MAMRGLDGGLEELGGNRTPEVIPGSTYRLQMSGRFGFGEACEVAGYLKELGITHLYLSPIFQTGKPDSHGYDVCDFNQVSRFLGGESGFERLHEECRKHQLHLILDFVPNHMGIASVENRWWTDVLRHGVESRWARYFDIEWRESEETGTVKVVLPVLGDLYGRVLGSGDLKIERGEDGFLVCYFDQRFAVGTKFYGRLLEWLTTEDERRDPEVSSALVEWRGGRAAGDGEDLVAAEFGRLICRLAEGKKRLERLVREINGTAGERESFRRLHLLLEDQSYRLAYWRAGNEEINYRRFFDVNDLAAVRMEEQEVFEASHRLLRRLLEEGKISGLRIDHPDGLADPGEYFRRLQRLYGKSRQDGAGQERKGGRGSAARCYVVAEKILCGSEQLPEEWLVHGTTGYDFLNVINGVFVAREKGRELLRAHRRSTGEAMEYDEVVIECKRWVLEHLFSSEMRRLAGGLEKLAARDWNARDFTAEQIRDGMAAVLVRLPVYRTYRRAAEKPRLFDLEILERAVEEAETASGEAGGKAELWKFFRQVLAGEAPDESEARREWEGWILKFQQLSGPLMAKAVEDMAFYRYYPLASLNEVGGEPGRLGVSGEEFHEFNRVRAKRWPHALSATATHDTKRGEDTRARLNVLSEIPEEWEAAVGRWEKMNRGKGMVAGSEASSGDRYLVYQTLIGIWPWNGPQSEGWADFQERVVAYMLKAAKEAKRRTSWIDVNSRYEKGLENFVRAILDRDQSAEYIADFGEFQRRTSFFGVWNSLAQVVLKCTAPGVPDFYQGRERWDFSLVDPDNRRPVDFKRSCELLAELDAGRWDAKAVGGLLRDWADDRLKMFVASRLLRFRRENQELFDKGEYIALEVVGEKRDHLLAFARVWKKERVLVAVPRLVLGLCDGEMKIPIGGEIWGSTSIRVGEGWRGLVDIWSGGEMGGGGGNLMELAAGEVLRFFPVFVGKGTGERS